MELRSDLYKLNLLLFYFNIMTFLDFHKLLDLKRILEMKTNVEAYVDLQYYTSFDNTANTILISSYNPNAKHTFISFHSIPQILNLCH